MLIDLYVWKILIFIKSKGETMKYIAKFVNSYWVSFNTETYENTQVFYLRKNAEEAVKKMNSNQRGCK